MFKAGTLIALWMTLAAAAGCASSGAVPQPFPRPGASADARPASPPTAVGTAGTTAAASGYEIAGTALSLRGTPYRSGGRDPGGFDCSGFVWYVFAQHGIHVSRTVTEQFHEGVEVPLDVVEPGDLLFFSTEAPGASHVGMAIGGDEFVHAPSARGQVRVERLSASYWSSRFIGARRIR